MITLDLTGYNLAFRELTAGWWALLIIFMAVVFMRYTLIGLKRNWRVQQDPILLVAACCSLFFMGASIRAVTTWGSSAAIHRGWPIEPWIQTEFYVIALLLSLIGGGGAVWLFSADRWRVSVVSVGLLLVFIVPIIVVAIP